MNIFTYIKERMSIFDVVNEHTTLKKAGTYYKARCPFHNEKTASFTVSPGKEIFYCFGCHLGGDVISFIANIENCSQLDAAKLLAERFNIELPGNVSFEHSEKNIKDKQHYHNICKAIAQWCHGQLIKSPTAQSYLKKRKISKQSSDYFTLGYFPGGLPAIKLFVDSMKKNNILPHDLITANILAQGKNILYSPFEERIIFPIKDSLGRFCGFGGRTHKPQDDRSKYYNSRENNYFTKGSLLFGLDLAKKNIQQTGSVFLVEGYTDCIAMVQHNYSNTIATLGTACTLQHLKQLARYANQLYVVYDSDSAGKQAIIRLTKLCWQVNLELNVVRLPTQEDPASYLEKHKDLAPLIQNTQDIFLFFINSVSKDFSIKPLGEKVAIARNLLQTINTVDDPLKRNILLQKGAKTLDIPFEALKQELTRLPKQYTNPAPVAAKKTEEPFLPKLEKLIFCAIMNNVQLFNKTNEKYIIKCLPSPLRDVLKQLKQIINEVGSTN